jgi:hypothetical protein
MSVEVGSYAWEQIKDLVTLSRQFLDSGCFIIKGEKTDLRWLNRFEEAVQRVEAAVESVDSESKAV